MTEEEAKTKWCPMARAVVSDLKSVSGNYGVAARCIASACMAWRTVTRNPHPRPVDDEHTVTLGFCGLAGAP